MSPILYGIMESWQPEVSPISFHTNTCQPDTRATGGQARAPCARPQFFNSIEVMPELVLQLNIPMRDVLSPLHQRRRVCVHLWRRERKIRRHALVHCSEKFQAAL